MKRLDVVPAFGLLLTACVSENAGGTDAAVTAPSSDGSASSAAAMTSAGDVGDAMSVAASGAGPVPGVSGSLASSSSSNDGPSVTAMSGEGGNRASFGDAGNSAIPGSEADGGASNSGGASNAGGASKGGESNLADAGTALGGAGEAMGGAGADPVVPTEPLTVFIAGDSTVQTYQDTASTTEQAGWGQMLHEYVNDLVTVENRAIGGRTARRFIDEGRLAEIDADITPGDYLLVQFGTNDQHTSATYEINGETIPYFLLHRRQRHGRPCPGHARTG